MVFDEKTQKQLGPNLCKIEESCDFSSDSSKKFSPLTSSSSSSKTSSFCKLLEGVVLAANSAVSSQSTAVFQGQFGMSHQEALGTVIRQPKTQDEALESSTEQPPILQPGTKSQNPVTVAQEHMSSPREPNTPKSDTYSWRKYGQKHVKSSGSSRSYFRCTSLSCCAKKKVQHLDDSGEIIEVIYKGDHNHDPPLNIIKVFSRKKSFGDASVKKADDTCREEPKQHVLQLTYESRDSHSNDSSAETLKSDVNEQHNKTPDTIARHQNELSTLPREVERGRSGNPNELGLIETMNERDIPIKKRRIKESGKESSQSVYRTFKEPKIVVQAPDGAGINSDGYKWRKYGQKMVKGNIHPRSYYRCSSPGCPVRKHVERATDGSLSIVAMYEGEHDHDKPLLKKQHGSLPTPSVLVNAHTDIPDKSSPVKLEEEKMASPSRAPSPQPTQSSTIDCDEPKAVPEAGTQKVLEPTQLSSNDCDEPKAVPEAGTPKVLDSAQALLSVNIELESC